MYIYISPSLPPSPVSFSPRSYLTLYSEFAKGFLDLRFVEVLSETDGSVYLVEHTD